LLAGVVDRAGVDQGAAVKPCKRSLVSMPAVGESSAPLTSVAGELERDLLQRPAETTLAGPDDPGWRSEKMSLIMPYMDEARTFVSGLEGLSDREPVWPMIRSVPTGWSRAFYVGQKILENLIDEALRRFAQCALLRGVGPIPDVASELGALPHCDNLNVFGLDKSAVQLVKDRVVSHLRARCFPVHEEVDASVRVTSLGWCIGGDRWSVCNKPERAERLAKVCSVIESGARLSGHPVQRWAGHVVDFFLIRREGLAALRSTYDFIDKVGSGRQRAWPSLRKSALGKLGVFPDPSSVIPEGSGGSLEMLEKSPHFQEAPDSMLKEEIWRGDISTRFRDVEGMPALEARAIVMGVRRGLRSIEGFKRPHLIMGDQLGNAMAFGKSRAASFSILNLIRRASALALASCAKWHFHWVPSEKNTADAAALVERRGADGGGHALVRDHLATASRGRWSAAAAAGSSRSERRSKRAATFGTFEPPAAAGQVPIPESHAIASATEGLYNVWFKELLAYTISIGCALDSVKSVDAAMTDFADYLFLEGFEKADLLKAHAAAACVAPAPIPRGIACWIARQLAEKLNSVVACLAALATFTAHLRSRWWALNLHPAARGHKSKIGLFDEVILLDAKYLPGLGAAVATLETGDPGKKLFDIEPSALLALWEAATRPLGFPADAKCVQCQLRHGGPSHDRPAGCRALPEIQRRGRWLAEGATRRYEASARVQQEWTRLSDDQQGLARRAVAWIEDRVRSLPLPAARPPSSRAASSTCAGCAGVSQALARNSIEGSARDALFSQEADLASLDKMRWLARRATQCGMAQHRRQLAAAGWRQGLAARCLGVRVAIACATWSRVRDLPPRPKIRD
ncbi:unnamed protein product, partial [Prorocentrum cordatum]